MHPLLFELPSIHLKIHVYGLMYALGFLFGLLFIQRESKRLGLSVDAMTDLFFYILVSGTVGSRILYVLIEAPEFLKNPLDIFKIWKGGLVYYGGLIGAILVSVLFCRKKKISFLKVADVFAPALALGHALGRVGCFFAGCCYGKVCDAKAWYAITFPEIPYGIAPAHIPLYPTQLMESFGNFAIFFALFLFRRKKTFDGQVFLLYSVLYGLMRALIEIFRGDQIRGYVIEGILSTSQFVSSLIVTGAIVLWILNRRKKA